MPGGCTLLFEPFAATQEHEDTLVNVKAGNIYGQSTEAIDIGDGVCKRLLARPVPGPDDGNIRAMSCHCPDGSAITAEPTWNDEGNVVWQESGAVCPTVTCKGAEWPRFLTFVYPCSVSTPRGVARLTASPDWATVPQHTCEFATCDGAQGLFYFLTDLGHQENVINIGDPAGPILIHRFSTVVWAGDRLVNAKPRLTIATREEASALLLASSASNPIEVPWDGSADPPVTPNVLLYKSCGPFVPYLYCGPLDRLHYTDDLTVAPEGCVFVC